MKIGLIGSGGREHAIAKALMKIPNRDSLFVYGSHLNPGIERIAKSSKVGDLRDVEKIGDFFSSNEVELVVIGPEVPLIAGVSDDLRSNGMKVIGPTRAQAQLEGSKIFMRDLMKRHVKKGTLAWREVRDIASARDFIAEVGQVAVKPVGLTGGKGVWVMGVHFDTVDAALEKVEYLIQTEGVLLLEERLIGEEFSRMAFVSNNTISPMPVAQDFKYAYDGDQGGMTGGMGSYTMADGSMPFLNKDDIEQADAILQETVSAIEEETGEDYRGFLYGQFMATADGVRVIEFNVRLGDPEAINVMALLNMDTAKFFEEIAKGILKKEEIKFLPQASICKYLVPSAYPASSKEQVVVEMNEKEIEEAGFSIIYASVTQKDIGLETLGSRAIALIGLGKNMFELSDKMEEMLKQIEPPTIRHRKDIGDERIVRAKIQKMKELRGIPS
ncbi:MAG: phosphoribosylamine--glycine ligase [Desulfobacterales bacterium]|nr:phosphoribosylamine--glycine ligase [Desulfobacterales bacterium]